MHNLPSLLRERWCHWRQYSNPRLLTLSSFSKTNINNNQHKNINTFQYIKTWVGDSDSTTSSISSPSTTSFNSYLTIQNKLQLLNSRSSYNSNQYPRIIVDTYYHVPTLRLHRSETPSDLQSLFKKNIPTDTNNNNEWRIPIILDLEAFQPDGSPHYKPPTETILRGFITVLEMTWGMSVIGVTNVSRELTGRETEVGFGFHTNMEGERERKIQKHTNAKRSAQKKIGILGDHVRKLGLSVLRSRNKGCVVQSGLSSSQYQRHRSNIDDVFTASDTIGMRDISDLARRGGGMTTCDNEKEESTTARGLELELDKRATTLEELHAMSYRELQHKCKERELCARGATQVLIDRLLTYRYSNSEEKVVHHLGRYTSDCTHSEENARKSITNNNNHIQQPLKPYTHHTKVYTGTIRSGQQVTTDEPNQSLIIIGNVRSGGEVMADGDVYVFGKLRGRALAGLAYLSSTTNTEKYHNNKVHDQKNNNTKQQYCQNHIFASTFDPELVCIGTTFTTVDSVTELPIRNSSMLTTDLLTSFSRSTVKVENDKDRISCMVRVDMLTGELVFESVAL